MDAIIGLAISMIGYVFCGIDFCTLYTLISAAIDIYEKLRKLPMTRLPDGR